jgi:hypothetical protein
VVSIVRQNLMTTAGYTPYCGAERCSLRWPRTVFKLDQFQCGCSWRSAFDQDFLAAYKAKWELR